MPELFSRHPANPIVIPGDLPWRRAVTFNPAAWRAPDGRTWLWERAAGSLRPFGCCIGALVSADGVHFERASEEPVLTPAQLGCEHGSVQDPRVVAIDGRLLMTYAYRPYAWNSYPTAIGVPESEQAGYPGWDGDPATNQTRSGIAESEDGLVWRHLAWVNGPELDDRNVILFPERVGGRYLALRRPSPFVSTQAAHDQPVGVKLSRSDDLLSWSEPEVVLEPAFAWESNRIGGSTPPIRTEAGWLVLYHGVETTDPAVRAVTYRVGAALLDLEDPTRVIARCPEPIMEPSASYERVGAYIPNVVFPTGAVVVDGELRLYYGCCDSVIALATARLDEVVAAVAAHPVG